MKQLNYVLILFYAIMASASSLTVKDTPWPNENPVYYPNSVAFINATTRWNAYGAPNYGAAVSPSREDEIIAIVS